MTAATADDDSEATLRTQVAEEVRVWLARRRMSGAELARRLGRSQTFIAKRLDGRQAMDLDDLQMIAAELHIPVTALFQAGLNSPGNESLSGRYQDDIGGVVIDFPLVRAQQDDPRSPARESLRHPSEHKAAA